MSEATDTATERPPTVLAYLTGHSERVQRATALVVLRMAQLHSQRAGAHAALASAEADLARALGFAPQSVPAQVDARAVEPASTSETTPPAEASPKIEAILVAARVLVATPDGVSMVDDLRDELDGIYRPDLVTAVLNVLTAAIAAVR